MRILFDDEIFFRQRFGGVSRIFATLLASISKNSAHQVTFRCGYSENEYLLQLYPNTPSFFRNLHFPFKGKLIRNIYGRFSHVITTRQLMSGKVDVFHPTFYADYYLPVLQKSKVPLVFTVHDLIHEQTHNNSHYQQMANIKARNIKLADQIIVVSEHTKKDLLRIYPEVQAEKVHVVPLAQSLPEHEVRPATIPEHYILFTGERGGYKNFSNLLKAFALIRPDYPQLHLFCAGGQPLNNTEIQLANELGVKPLLTQARLTDEELRYAYRHAAVFVFPSTYEGFGIPMLEAFNSKVPVVANNATSLPEVGGDAAFYADATKPQALADGIQKVLSDAQLRAELIHKGYLRSLKFSWENHVQQTISVYNKALR